MMLYHQFFITIVSNYVTKKVWRAAI